MARSNRGASATWALATAIASLLALAAFAGSWVFDASAPPNGAGDYWFHAAQVKTILEQGWYPVHNPALGAPWGQEPFDYPSSDALNYLLVKLLGLFLDDWASILKAYYLIGFPVIAAATCLLFAAMGARPEWAASGAIAFTFLPFHFLRIPHVWFATYLAVPITMGLCLSVARPDLFMQTASGSRRGMLAAALAAFALAGAGAYFAFFGTFFLAISGVFFWVVRREAKIIANAAILVTVVVAGVAVNLLPSWTYARTHGVNPLALPQRDLDMTESNALKVTQLVLPTPNHRLKSLRDQEHRYASTAPMVAENRSSALGLVGVVGLLVLGCHVMRRLAGQGGEEVMLGWLACLTAAALVLASPGGVSSLFALFVTPLIRGWNRISVFVGFFAAGALALGMSRAVSRIGSSLSPGRVRAMSFAAAVGVAVFAAWDQTPVMDSTPLAMEARRDRDYFARVESAVEPDGMIFQLPYFPFPEGGSSTRWSDYSHVRGYLYTRSLRWSYGAMKGREADVWYQATALLPPALLGQFLAERGFSGIHVDRRGYPEDGAARVTAGLREALGEPVVVSADGDMLLFKVNRLGNPEPGFEGLALTRKASSLPVRRGNCNIDTVMNKTPDPVLRLGGNAIVDIRGWVGDPGSRAVPEGAMLYLISGELLFEAIGHIGLPRADVAAGTGAATLENAGFVVLLSAAALPAGTYSVAVGFSDQAGAAMCATAFVVEIEDKG